MYVSFTCVVWTFYIDDLVMASNSKQGVRKIINFFRNLKLKIIDRYTDSGLYMLKVLVNVQ